MDSTGLGRLRITILFALSSNLVCYPTPPFVAYSLTLRATYSLFSSPDVKPPRLYFESTINKIHLTVDLFLWTLPRLTGIRFLQNIWNFLLLLRIFSIISRYPSHSIILWVEPVLLPGIVMMCLITLSLQLLSFRLRDTLVTTLLAFQIISSIYIWNMNSNLLPALPFQYIYM